LFVGVLHQVGKAILSSWFNTGFWQQGMSAVTPCMTGHSQNAVYSTFPSE
jgi:hypothetical protein